MMAFWPKHVVNFCNVLLLQNIFLTELWNNCELANRTVLNPKISTLNNKVLPSKDIRA